MRLDEEARNAYCLNRALELHGKTALNRLPAIGCARVMARLDMIEKPQFDISAFVRARKDRTLRGNKLRPVVSTVETLLAANGECGTAACMAGWATIEKLAYAPDIYGAIETVAAKFMVLTDQEAVSMFFPIDMMAKNRDYTLARGKAVLIHFWKTGSIRWDLALCDELPYSMDKSTEA